MNVKIANSFSATLHKFGLAGVAFFLIKGVLWLIAPIVFAWFF